MSGVHLFVPMLHRRDAVGEHTRALRDALVAAGVESRVYTEHPDPDTADETTPYRTYADQAEAGDLLVYQLATASALAGWLAARPERLVVNYHSVTPPGFFARWSNGITRLQAACLAERALLAPRAELGIAVSAFDEAELTAAGYRRTTVVPVATPSFPPQAPDALHADAVAAWRRRHGGTAWLSVGRLVPNKAHHRTIAALYVARATGDPGASLRIVGSPSEPAYAAALRRYAVSLGLEDAVAFVSGLSGSALAAEYQTADVLVLLSEHEGFGVPLVEAMAHGTPIVARAAGAVPEVTGEAAVLLPGAGPRQVAAAVGGLVADWSRREALVSAGRRRAAALGVDGAAGRAAELLASVWAGASH